MARHVFFSFHYERDIWRASQVRNSWVTQPNRESSGFWDAASWEEVKKKGDLEVKKWIRDQMKGTSVTVVLIGTETSVDWERGAPSTGVSVRCRTERTPSWNG